MKATTRLATIVVMVTTCNSFAADWPQYLGPERNSTSPEKGLLRAWPESGPEILWTVELGRGYGGPVIQDGKVYLLDREEERGDNLRCFDLSSGKELWNFAYQAPGSVSFPGSRSVPTVDGNHVYSCGHNGDLYCIDIGTNRRRDGLVCMSMDGQIMWKTKRSPDFNKGSMILVDGLILATDGRTTLYLIEPDPSGFKPLASAELLGEAEAGANAGGRSRSRFRGSNQNWGPLALSEGKLLIRNQNQMKCVVVR